MVCINYNIERCLGPCVGNISKKEYRKQIDEIIDLLDGKTDKLIRSLNQEIKKAAENQKYEQAAYLRDKMIAIENISQKQKVSNINENSIDVIGIARNDLSTCVEVSFIRQSRIIGREKYFLNNV